LECALYDVQGVSMSPSIGEDGYLIEGEALGLAVLRLKDGIELEIWSHLSASNRSICV